MPSSSTGPYLSQQLCDAAPVSSPRVPGEPLMIGRAAVELRTAVELNRAAPADDARVEALRVELRTLDSHAAAKALATWLGKHSLQAPISSSSSSSSSSANDPLQANVVSLPQQAAPAVEPPIAAPLETPPGTDKGVGPDIKMYDAEPVSMDEMCRISNELLTMPHYVYHGERDDRQRQTAPVYEFPVHVRLLTRTQPQSPTLIAPRVSARGR